MKKLYRSEKDSLIAGVIGGIGEYFDIDPTVLRLGFIVLVLLTGIFPGIIAYILAYFIIPDEPKDLSTFKNEPSVVSPKPAPKTEPEPEKENEVEENETLSELKKPDWTLGSHKSIVDSQSRRSTEIGSPTKASGQKEETETKTLEKKVEELETETPPIESLMDEKYASLDDVIEG